MPRSPAGGVLPLRRGDIGEAVRDLQERLALIGYGTGVDHQEFGAATEASLRQFQNDRGLVVDGICGPQSWNALVEADHRLGDRLLYYRAPMMRGDDVAEVQRRLGQLGFDAYWVDGILGPRTQTAIRQFQQNVGLPDDGVVGRSTVEALERLTRRSAAEVTIAEVREHERLRLQPSRVEGRRVVIGDTGELPVIAQAVARRLRHAGAEVLSFSTPDLSHQARTSNQWNGDIYLGVTLAVDNFGFSYFATRGFESVGRPGAGPAVLRDARSPAHPSDPGHRHAAAHPSRDPDAGRLVSPRSRLDRGAPDSSHRQGPRPGRDRLVS